MDDAKSGDEPNFPVALTPLAVHPPHSEATNQSRDLETPKSVVQMETQNPDPNTYTLKAFSLITLTLQNAILILVMRYVRTREGDLFKSTTAVILSEFLKFSGSLLVIFWMEGKSVLQWWQHLNKNIFQQPMDCLKISVPAIVYTLQNNLLYIAVSNLEAATFQVTYQLKILTTALFSVVMLRKELSRLQWVALLVLFMGVSAVQLQPHETKDASKIAQDQNPMLGLIAVVVSCVMSGFAGVYFEKMLKGTEQTLWLRNVQLGFLGVVIGCLTMEINDGVEVHKQGFFFGYDWLVWCVVLLNSFGGIMVAVVVKYADNILKGFATSAAIVISCIASMYFFDFQLSIQFTVGAALVILAVYMYGKFPPVPKPGQTGKLTV